jgi:hypothetical protein
MASALDTSGLSTSGIGRHRANHHIALPQAPLYYQMVARAEEQGLSIEEYQKMQGAEYVGLEVMVDKFNRRLMDEDFQPDFKDGMAAIKLMSDLKRGVTSNSFTAADLFVALSQFRNHVNAVISRYLPTDASVVMRSLDSLIDNDPILGAMSIKSSGGIAPPQENTFDIEEDEDVEDALVVGTSDFNDDWEPEVFDEAPET